MRIKLLLLAAAFLLQACGVQQYKPTEFPLRPGTIQPFDVKGAATVNNGQPATDEVIVYSYVGQKLASNLNAITETMVQQARSEIAKNGRAAAGRPKTIELKVNSLVSNYVFAFWKSSMQYQVKLGNGQTIEKTVTHGSGMVFQDLNGCIAEGVMNLLKDEKVLAYLAG